MSSNEWNTQARVEEVIEKSEKLGIKNSVIVLEAWSDENTFYIWNEAKYNEIAGSEKFIYDDFQFDKGGMWPNPKEMIDKIHDMGMKILLWQIPAMKKNDEEHIQLGIDTEHMLHEKYSVHKENQKPYKIRPFWFRDGLLMDFTNPKGAEWWMEKRRYLLEDLKIDGFKTDGGEHIWGRDLVFSDGRKSDAVWNEYPNLYAGEYYKYSKKINSEAITFSRAGYTGAQAFPCHWAGDENSTWEAFQRSILAGLNAGISGIPFWGWDFAGFSGDIPSAELYLRSAAMATFSPIMQYHSEFNHHKKPSNDRTPWNIAERTGNDQVIPIFRSFLDIRNSMMPYILQMAEKSSEEGIPMIRAMQISFPQDANIQKYPYQYMFGDSYLISPVTEPNTLNISVYLPKGKWKSIWDDTSFIGGKSYSIPTRIETIPVFKRE
jgi:alpha-glucosidase (family GH31 glycosyl hydrolase)